MRSPNSKIRMRQTAEKNSVESHALYTYPLTPVDSAPYTGISLSLSPSLFFLLSSFEEHHYKYIHKSALQVWSPYLWVWAE